MNVWLEYVCSGTAYMRPHNMVERLFANGYSVVATLKIAGICGDEEV
jgi:hypothetical protein